MTQSHNPSQPPDEKLTFDPTRDSNGPSVYVGALVPQRLEELLQREAAQRMVPRSQIVRWALAERYMEAP
ncbi:MAG: hypothetical protein PVH17_09380 [Anaerolineae bacterium]|jgi:hypothetical protein